MAEINSQQEKPICKKRIRDFVPTPTLHCIYNALNSVILIMARVIVEKVCLTGYKSLRTVLLVFEPFLDMTLMPTAYSDNSIGLNTQFQIQKASMVYSNFRELNGKKLVDKIITHCFMEWNNVI